MKVGGETHLHRVSTGADNKPHRISQVTFSAFSGLFPTLLSRRPASHLGPSWESVRMPCPLGASQVGPQLHGHISQRGHMLTSVLGYTETCGSLKLMNFSELRTMVWDL